MDTLIQDRSELKSPEVVRVVRHVTWVGFWVNAALVVLKLFFGITGHSDALVADGVHSLSDFASDLLVIGLIGLAYQHADREHPYGHGKIETFASLLVGVLLMLAGVGICIDGIVTIKDCIGGAVLERPSIAALAIAIISILSKEVLFHYTRRAGRRVNSPSLIANAWHHRSDAISSVATVIGILAAILLSEHWRVLDPVASVLIAVFIVLSGWKIAWPAISELLERSLPDEATERIEQIIRTTPGVIDMHHLRTRRNGHSTIIDCHIKVDPDITVTAGHAIATDVEHRLRQAFGTDLIANIHVEPNGISCAFPT